VEKGDLIVTILVGIGVVAFLAMLYDLVNRIK